MKSLLYNATSKTQGKSSGENGRETKKSSEMSCMIPDLSIVTQSQWKWKECVVINQL